MIDQRVPELEAVASPPRRELDYYDLQITEKPLGEGGQTVVYEAAVPDSKSPEKVAIRQTGSRGFKESVHREEVNSFLNQAETWISVAQREQTEPRWSDSDHIVGVVDIGENLPWAALEYMDGGSLADRLEGTDGLPLPEAVWIGERLCQGLQVAHSTGVAHLDLKPSNILFRKTSAGMWDVPKIADWGLARNLLDETSASMEVLSTRYAAPEQFDREEFGRPGTATDVYQLGAVMYALTTGRPPYTGESERGIIFDIVNEELPPPPSQRQGEISRELDAAVRTALEPRQADRYSDINAFKRALRAIRSGGQLPPVVRERIGATKHTKTEAVAKWPMYGFGSNRQSTAGDDIEPEKPVTSRWEFDTSGLVKSSPAVVDGTAYIGSGNSLFAVDAATGTEQWEFQTEHSVGSSPAVANGTVYIGNGDMWGDEGILYAVDAVTGEKQWQFKTSGRVESSPAIVDGTVYVGSNDHSLYAVDAATGRKHWQFDTASWVHSSPAVVDGTIYVGNKNGCLHAVDAISGTEEWKFSIEGEMVSSPAVKDTLAYIAVSPPLSDITSDSAGLYAVDVVTGKEKWHYDDFSMKSSPAIANGTVYIGSNSGSLYAFNAVTGRKQWGFSANKGIVSSPAVLGDTVYIGSNDNNLYAVNRADGSKRWQFKTGGRIRSSPSVINGCVYFGSNDKKLYAVE